MPKDIKALLPCPLYMTLGEMFLFILGLLDLFCHSKLVPYLDGEQIYFRRAWGCVPYGNVWANFPPGF